MDISKPPPRPANPIDPEIARPTPDEDMEIGKANKLAEDNENKSTRSKVHKKASRSSKDKHTQ
jgi:hypothetical protein